MKLVAKSESLSRYFVVICILLVQVLMMTITEPKTITLLMVQVSAYIAIDLFMFFMMRKI
jgi:hypothetical protein